MRTKPVEPPAPPEGLAEPGRALWAAVVGLRPCLRRHELELLRLACVASDRNEQARVEVETNGMTRAGRFGLVRAPAVNIERETAATISRILRQLQLPSHWQSPQR